MPHRLRVPPSSTGTSPTGKIQWDGATEILPLHLDAADAQNFLEAMALEGRTGLLAIVDSRDTGSAFFLTDVEVASAMGAITFTMVGTRIAGEGGGTERLIGMMRETTERVA